MSNLFCKVSSEEGHMIISTISFDPVPILLSDPDPLKQIISGLGGSDSAPQHCNMAYCDLTLEWPDSCFN